MVDSNDNAAPNGGTKDVQDLWTDIDNKVSQAEGICALLSVHAAIEGDVSSAAWGAQSLLTDASRLLADLHKLLPEVAHD